MGICSFFPHPLPSGTRVYLLTDTQFGGPFLEGATGTVLACRRARNLTSEAARKSRFVYQIQFDVPQLDSDGDGPYAMSEVLAQYVVQA